MVMLEVTEKILRTSIEVMAVELELSRVMKKRVGNALFKKRASHLVIYDSGPSKTQVDSLGRTEGNF